MINVDSVSPIGDRTVRGKSPGHGTVKDLVRICASECAVIADEPGPDAGASDIKVIVICFGYATGIEFDTQAGGYPTAADVGGAT